MCVLGIAALGRFGRSVPATTTSQGSGALRDEGDAAAWLHRLFHREMSAYSFFLDAELQHKLAMQPEPVLTFPAKLVDYAGQVYVWTDRGRPAVVGCVFAGQVENTDRFRLFHEFHSLSLKPLAEVGGADGWQPEEAGIKFEPVPDMAEPGEKKDRRLTQMRAIVHRFDSSMIWRDMKVELPLLTRLLYRYEVPDNDPVLVDGAVFAYGHKEIQDPEVLLIVESAAYEGQSPLVLRCRQVHGQEGLGQVPGERGVASQHRRAGDLRRCDIKKIRCLHRQGGPRKGGSE